VGVELDHTADGRVVLTVSGEDDFSFTTYLSVEESRTAWHSLGNKLDLLERQQTPQVVESDEDRANDDDDDDDDDDDSVDWDDTDDDDDDEVNPAVVNKFTVRDEDQTEENKNNMEEFE
jgi:hypothetical protein